MFEGETTGEEDLFDDSPESPDSTATEEPTSPGDDTPSESEDGKLPKRVRDDVYRRLSKSEAQVEELQRTLDRTQGSMDQMLAQQAELMNRSQPPQDPGGQATQQTQELSKEDVKWYMENDPDTYFEHKFSQRMEQERSKMRQEILSDVEHRGRQVNTQRALKQEFPELNNLQSPFSRKTNEVLQGLYELHGVPDKASKDNLLLAHMAAERVAREFPDLRDGNQRQERQGRSQSTAAERLSNGGNLDPGRPGPNAGKPSKEVQLPDHDAIGSKWFPKDYQDKKRVASLKDRRKYLEGQRLDLRDQPDS